MRKLSPKQRDFAYYYAMMDPEKKSGTAAAIKAGYSEKNARKMASENLTKANIQEAIEEHQKTIRQEAKRNHNIINPIELLEGYSREIRFNPKNLFDENGALIPPHKLDDEVAICLAGIKYTAQGDIEYKIPDKRANRDSMAKILGLANNGHGKELIPEWLSEFLRNLLGLQKDDSSETKAVEIQAGLRILVNSVDGLTRGIPSQPKMIEVDNG